VDSDADPRIVTYAIPANSEVSEGVVCLGESLGLTRPARPMLKPIPEPADSRTYHGDAQYSWPGGTPIADQGGSGEEKTGGR